jgi:hypothetical protein
MYSLLRTARPTNNERVCVQWSAIMIELEKNRCKYIAHALSYTIGLDYAPSETIRAFIVAQYIAAGY